VKGAPLIFIFILTHDIFTHDILIPQQYNQIDPRENAARD
jgi:hypothetical protein